MSHQRTVSTTTPGYDPSSPSSAYVVAFACPGGIEHLVAEQHASLAVLSGLPTP